MNKSITALEFMSAADGSGFFVFDWTGSNRTRYKFHLFTIEGERFLVMATMPQSELQLLLRAYLIGKDYGTLLRVRLD